MTTIRRFSCNDLLRFTSVNLDHLTETVRKLWFCRIIVVLCYGDLLIFVCSMFSFVKQFNMSFYMTYLARWPDYFHVAEGPGNRVMGYSKESFLFVLVFVSVNFCLRLFYECEFVEICVC